jgi:type I restriction enzyme S subunit
MSKQENKVLVPELRFPMFQSSENWVIDNLGENTVKVGSGITPKGGDKNYKSEGVFFIRSQNIGWGNLLLNDVAFIDVDIHNSFLSTEINKDDVLLNITGASIGRSAVATKKIEGGNVNQHVCIIRTKKKRLIPLYLNQFILSQYGQDQIDSFQAGGNRQGLNFSQIRTISIPLPQSLDEQQKVSDCLSSMDDLITTNTKRLELLKSYKKGLMQKLFPERGKNLPELRFDGFNESWKKKPFSKLFEIGSGKDHKHLADGDIPVYGSGGYMRSVNDYLYEGKSACIGRKGTINRPMLLDGKFWTVDTLFYTHSFKNCIPEFVYLLFQNIDWLKLNEAGGIPSLSKVIINKIEVLIPEEDEQQRIVDCVSSLDELIKIESNKIEALKEYKKGLMQKLFPEVKEFIA